jgi:competence protein ComEA
MVVLLLAAHFAGSRPPPSATVDRAADLPGGGEGPQRLKLDPNLATVAELDLLPGLGPQLSARIVAYRQECGQTPPFACPEDLSNVRGIGPKLVETLRPLLCFAPFSAAADGGP